MVARVLVVDDILANVKLLEARLSAEYFQVATAHSGREALEHLQAECVDVILLDVMMPGMDGFEVCRRLKSGPETMHIPVIMVTALDQASDRVQGLEAGADDFLTKPIDEVALITRVKNLARLKALNDEMRMRLANSAEPGVLHSAFAAWSQAEPRGRVLVVDDRLHTAGRIADTLSSAHSVEVETSPQTAMLRLIGKPFDLLIAPLDLASTDALRLCAQVRSLEATRHLPIVVVVGEGEQQRLLRSLDMGINDYVTRPIERNELLARVRTQIRRKRHADHLRDRLAESVELALIDPLTGLHNRRYMEGYLSTLFDQARTSPRPLTLLLADIDNFKQVNDTHGHAAGDDVLREFARRLRRNSRAADLACRIGGEEFVVIMPDTSLERACQIGERLRVSIAGERFNVGLGSDLAITASVGIAAWTGISDSLDALFRRADKALYFAKRNGRNRVAADAA